MSFMSQSRGMQIWADVYRRQPRDWLALDDDYMDWPRWCIDNYIRTHEKEGIGEPLVQELIRNKLRQMCEGNEHESKLQSDDEQRKQLDKDEK